MTKLIHSTIKRVFDKLKSDCIYCRLNTFILIVHSHAALQKSRDWKAFVSARLYKVSVM